ncbi:MAG TPA: amine oxidase [Candidatus Competibacteraceae bacterium]|nr:amine oxidase [Candidatus Competibacteraceae bacterium]
MDHDLLVVGAGISGLSMAYYAAEAGLKVRVLEQEQRPGGCLHSHRFGDASQFWLELGAHSAFNSYGNLLALLESAQALDRLRKRAKVGFRMFVDGKVRGIPSQLSIPNLLPAPWRLRGASKVGRTVAEYYGRIVGQRNYEAVFGPAFDAVICQPAGDYPAESLFQARPRRKDVPRGFTMEGGLQTIADLLSARPDLAVERDRAVRAVRREGETFIIQTDQGDYTARALCLATPVAVAVGLLKGAFPAVAGLLAEIGTATVETVGVALPADRLRLPPVAGLIGRNQPFYSIVSRDTVPDARWRGFSFHFRPAVLDEQGRLDCIARVLNVPKAELGSKNTVFKINQLPALRVGQGKRAIRLDIALAGTRLALAGNYFGGVAIEDCVTRARAEFERLQRQGW